ncbi:rhamnulokinase [Goodfellowiella coeruleoviolacea]|uniref:Rhamnulokinase n=1 Tax=Goodfellowiella coeruleoviolacea TaxID=334858 RepID=A0AAE3GBV7_9PSEU|nr:rhamnulokinase family protein [Goodfellowiella coeruleoviolacea]MCP2164219.1 rhamnulokinase [Goodfellowiella coeruleoviolacea]
MDSSIAVAAVDLGASSGRVVLGRVGPDRLELTEAHRFPNGPVPVRGTLHWDVLGLYRGVLEGLRAAGPVASIGIDTWAVDYGLLDESGTLLGNPVCYRDARTDGVLERVLDRVAGPELYQATGLQLLPINTLIQLVAEQDGPHLGRARHLLPIPDLLSYWLTGVLGVERTNASTTQLLDVHTGQWAHQLMRRFDIDPALFGPLRDPGDAAGEVTDRVGEQTGLAAGTPVTAVGSHDTASAVVGVPADGADFGYISCGTWSLVGVELPEPVLSEPSRLANFTNERGVDNTIRYLRNVMGLWLVQESLRTWRLAGRPVDLAEVTRAAAEVPGLRSVIDPDDAVFLPPGDMPARIAEVCRRTGQPVPEQPAEVVRCVLDSLALAYQRALRDAQRLSGRKISVVHLVGGGARNELLCQLTADACGLPVLAGPVEATAIGNVLVQARAAGVLRGGLDQLRELVRRTHALPRYEPTGDPDAWRRAAERLVSDSDVAAS